MEARSAGWWRPVSFLVQSVHASPGSDPMPGQSPRPAPLQLLLHTELPSVPPLVASALVCSSPDSPRLVAASRGASGRTPGLTGSRAVQRAVLGATTRRSEPFGGAEELQRPHRVQEDGAADAEGGTGQCASPPRPDVCLPTVSSIGGMWSCPSPRRRQLDCDIASSSARPGGYVHLWCEVPDSAERP